ncbi:spermidine/putrescine ABC transporter substrate-binding protein [Effusibacillus lacus]|uniref:Spermidine/putrescine ABC transporter substrate-binding protein n=1 Tax=Effusibacillus lacus TaxID=1348429 RepID=A0A292YIV0_9BACL|nr:formate dehydrogenase major subunit [Effusibacillus lacus]GAX89066.1 spermidine/putrescine ABC transporter substrate-binding protein [Effusibacillus lacus]
MATTKEVKTICGYCGTGCGLVLEVSDNQIVRVRGDKEAPVNKGQTCVKGAFAYKYVHAPERLKQPLLRKEGKLTPVSWSEALDVIAQRLADLKSAWGPDSIAMFACARATNETNYVTQKFMRAAIGSNNIDGCNRT